MKDKIAIENTLIAGVDVHKYQHEVILMTPYSKTINKYQINNTDENLRKFARQIKLDAQGKQVLFGLEDVNGNGKKLSRFLSQNFIVYGIPSTYTDHKRRLTPHQDKDDELDARRIAEVLISEYETDKLPKFNLTEQYQKSTEAEGVVKERNNLVKQSTALKNQLHVLFHELYGDNYKEGSSYNDIYCKSALSEWEIKLNKSEATLVQRILFKIRMLKLTLQEISFLETELKKNTKENTSVKILTSIKGCGEITAHSIMSEIKDIKRFRSGSSLAKYCGIAPRVSSSGRQRRYYTNKRGNRKLNNHFNTIVLSMIGKNGSKEAKKYYRKKQAEGKSKLHSMRCLKRRIVDIVYQMLIKNETYSYPR